MTKPPTFAEEHVGINGRIALGLTRGRGHDVVCLRLLHAIYERIVVAGPEIVRVRLKSAAYAHGLALALELDSEVPIRAPKYAPIARPTATMAAARMSTCPAR